MGQLVRETERKYGAPAELELADPGRLFELAVGSQDEAELDATYYDNVWRSRHQSAGMRLRLALTPTDSSPACPRVHLCTLILRLPQPDLRPGPGRRP